MAGVDVKAAQTRLGHSDPRLTLAVYVQATTEADKAAASSLGECSRSREERERSMLDTALRGSRGMDAG